MFSIEDFLANKQMSGPKELFSIATSPHPGLHFSAPYLGVSFWIENLEIFAQIPDVSEELEDSRRLLGRFGTSEEEVQLVADFIENEDLEVPLAVFCHHIAIPPDDFPLWSALPHYFWLRPARDALPLVRGIDASLRCTSNLYRELVRVISQDPYDTEGDYFSDQLDFSDIYARFSKSNRKL